MTAPPADSEPLVSILIPSFNGAAHIQTAVRSALAQTHRHLEVLVADDGSSDGTPELAEAAGGGDRRLRVIRRSQNLGPFENPIALLRESRGTFVKYLLHDDVLAPTCVRRLLEPMLADPRVMLATSKRSLIDHVGRRLSDQPFNAAVVSEDRCLDGLAFGTALLRAGANAIGELSTVLMRRSDLDPGTLWTFCGRELVANGDFALFLTLIARGRVFVTPEELSSFRIHDAQRSQDEGIDTGGIADWVVLVQGGQALGFLPDDASRRDAWASVLARASAWLVNPLRTQARTTVESTAAKALAALDDIGLDAGPIFDAAVAAPALDGRSAQATADALRAVAPHASRLLVAVDPARVDEAIMLLEPALGAGDAELDVDLVPCDDPRRLLTPGRLAVVAPGCADAHRPWSGAAAAAPLAVAT